MKLPITLLVLAALSQAFSVPVTKISEAKTNEASTSEASTSVAKTVEAKSSAAKNSAAKQEDQNETSKRELYEGNFGERTKDSVLKIEVSGSPPKNVYSKEMQEMVSEQTPAHQVFGVQLPQHTKISDVLSGHAPSFEAAVARQLYSPVSVYQTRVSSPTTFEVPVPAASQSAYSNPEAYKQHNNADNEQKLQKVLPKSVELPRPPLALYTVKQPFDSHLQPLSSGLSRQYQNLPNEVFRLHEEPRKHTPLLFPVYDQRGPFRHPGQFVPTQYLHQNGIFQIFPVGANFVKGYQEGNNNQDYSIENNYEQMKGERKLQIDFPVQKQEYHAHPNGAISFARFTHNLPEKTQQVPQPRPDTFHQPQRAQYQSQGIPVQLPSQIQPEIMLQPQQQQAPSLNQKLPYPSILQGIIQDLQHYQPIYKQQNQFSRIEQPRTMNTLQQHLLHQHPQQSSNLQIVQLQSVPSFNPQLLQKIAERKPRPFGYIDQSQPQLKNNDLSLEQASAQLTALPPLKPNYSKYVKPLEPRTTSPIFLPTTLQQHSTSTAKVEHVPDQLISSTTIQPDVKDQEGTNTQFKQEETETRSPTPQPEPEIIHQSQPTVSPSPGQTTTYLPFITNEPQSLIFQTTPQPSYQSTIRPTSQKHDVVIQRQEIQEIFLEPPVQPPRAPHDGNGQKLYLPYPEPELQQLRAQPHYQFFEQLLPYRHEMQDIHSPQELIVEARQSQQNPSFGQQGKTGQYVVQQNSLPLQFQQFQPAQLQYQHLGLEQGQQQQQESNQAQQHQRALEQAQQRQQKVFELLQQHQESDQQQLLAQHRQQAQQRQEALEQEQRQHLAEQQQDTLEQAQHQQQAEQQQTLEQAQHQHLAEQQQETLEQAQHQQQAEQQQTLEQAQHQQQAEQQQTLEQTQHQQQAEQQQTLEQAQHQQQAEQAQHQQQAEQQQTLEQQKQELEQSQQLSQESEQVLKQQYQQNSLESTNQIVISTLTPLQNTEQQTETVEIQQQTESQTEVQQDLKFQSTTGKSDEQPEHLTGPTPNLEQPYVGPYLTSSLNSQIYANHHLVPQSEQSPLLSVPSYTDVQYFGKFAQALFGGQH